MLLPKSLRGVLVICREREVPALFLLLCCFSMPQVAQGQVFGTASNSITVVVQPITYVQVTVGILNLSFSGTNAVAGQDQMTLTDQTSTLMWGTNSSSKKITVKTSLASPKYTLQLEAVSPTAGVSAGQLTLTTTAKDLITGMGRTMGSCALLYKVTALASQGTGADAHTITFTITS